MTTSTSAPVGGTAARRFRGRPFADIIAEFRTLHAPAIGDMHGEYSRTLLQADNPLLDLGAPLLISTPAHRWLAKAFRPIDSDHGIGYNVISVLGTRARGYPMRTLLAPSRYDGRPAFQLLYGAFRSPLGATHTVDEIRVVSPGVYLGIGHIGLTARLRRTPIAFVLEGPTAQYVGDIGRARPGFVPGPDELPAVHSRSLSEV